MPGLSATPVDSAAVHSGVRCPHCELILRDPVQTGEGLRLCRSCFDDIAKMPGCHCEKCDSTVTPEEFYPDRAVQRDINRILVYCKYKDLGCDWQGVLKEWEGHTEECKFKGISCPFPGCEEMLLASELDRHKLECGFRPVNCEHCNAELKFNELEEHHTMCLKYPVTCDREGCGEIVIREKMAEHQLENCAIEDCLICHRQVIRSTGVELGGNSIHLSSGLKIFKHHQDLARRQLVLQKELDTKTAQFEGSVSNIRQAMEQLEQWSKENSEIVTNKVMELKSQVEGVRKHVSSREPETSTAAAANSSLLVRLKNLEQLQASNQQVIKTQRKEIDELRGELATLKREYHHQLQQQRSALGSPRYTAAVSGRETHGAEREVSESRVLQVERRLEEVARQANSAQIHVQEIELQLQASLASTFNGGFLWRIPDVARRRREAVEERVMSLYSPPFYTARNGYKMCIRAYLNGDGMGYKTHLSLFFVLMKGEFDALLKWPFEHKISMILVDQDHKKHIVQTFKPTTESNSFQRPKTDMNVASGCPQFSKLSVLDEESYVREDVMFVKCIIDTSRIFHP